MIVTALTAAAFLTSVISAIVGMGGGILLLSAMTFFLPMQIIIPVHGLVQLISNSTRIFYLKEHIKWSFFFRFTIGLPFGAALAALALRQLVSETLPYLVITILIFYSVFKPKRMPHFRLQNWGWIGLGFFAGLTGVLAGAVGPLIAPFFIRDDLKKEEVIATKASMQMITHLAKIPVFLSLGFAFQEHSMLIGAMVIAAILGTRYGVLILDKVDELIFRKLFKGVLFVSGIRLLFKLIETIR